MTTFEFHVGLKDLREDKMDNMSYPVMLTLMMPNDTKLYRNMYFACFLVLYFLILTINLRLVIVIAMEKALHEPMYIFLCHMCINCVYGASGFYPNFLSNLITNSYVISFHMCALQTYDLREDKMDNMSYPVMLTLMMPKDTKLYRNMYFACFLVLYFLILSINLRLVIVIAMEKALHEPMYIFLCHMCINCVYGASGFYPNFLSNLITNSYVISFHMCSMQAYVIYSSLLSEITILTVMSYDRYVAICKPLDYHSRLTKNTCMKLILLSWMVPTCFCVITATLTNLRPICKYHIDKLYCDNWSIVKLSCASSFVNNVLGYVMVVVFLGFVVLTIMSYIKLISACKTSLENRRKFWQTCLPHIFSLINFISAYIFDIMYSRYGSNDINESLRNFLALELVIIPPVLNPLIYGLNIRAVRRRVFLSAVLGTSIPVALEAEATEKIGGEADKISWKGTQVLDYWRWHMREIGAGMENISSSHILTVTALTDWDWTSRIIVFSFALPGYLLTVFLNSSLIVIIACEKALHEPMYIFLCNLCINDLCGTTGFYPKAFVYLLTERNTISHEECIIQGMIIVIYATVTAVTEWDWTSRIIVFSFALPGYLLTIFLNSSLIVIIACEKALHEPMYIFLCNLCINDLCGTTGFYPKAFVYLLTERNTISHEECIIQGLVIIMYAVGEFTNLSVMAIDRYVAICRPLHYYSIMSPVTVLSLVAFVWLVPCFVGIMAISMTLRYPLCRHEINKLFCENLSLLNLTCKQDVFQGIVQGIIYIMLACRKSKVNQEKFYSTCIPHLISFLNTCGGLFDSIYTTLKLQVLPQMAYTFLSFINMTVPPILNPI
ncbi:hypothetical protein DNTS_034139, partial [Danionella cerebrum]